MDELEREGRRDTFLSTASDYAAVRPEYPGALLERALRSAALRSGARLLEIGCGTGQLTGWLGQQGFAILALDRSEAMVAEGRYRFGHVSGIRFEIGDFDSFHAPGSFDGIVAATSFHWLDPATRVARCADHLGSDGALIILRHRHRVSHEGFFQRVQSVYEAHVPEWGEPPPADTAEAELDALNGELEAGGLFRVADRGHEDWDREYDRDAYLRLLTTFSDHARLDPNQRNALLADIGRLIDAEYNGCVRRPLRTDLIVARRVGDGSNAA